MDLTFHSCLWTLLLAPRKHKVSQQNSLASAKATVYLSGQIIETGGSRGPKLKRMWIQLNRADWVYMWVRLSIWITRRVFNGFCYLYHSRSRRHAEEFIGIPQEHTSPPPPPPNSLELLFCTAASSVAGINYDKKSPPAVWCELHDDRSIDTSLICQERQWAYSN